MAILGAGGALSASIQGVAFTSSTTYSPPFDCKAMVYVIGGGGSGGTCYNINSAGEVMCASGGAAGGCAVSLLDLKAAHTYTITVGAGGARVSKTYNSHGSGIAGGNTTFVDGSGTISTMTGNGGGAGDSSKASTNSGTTATAATGGSASGGALANNTGGASGAATVVWTSGFSNSTAIASSGGGAVGLFGTGYASGVASNVPGNYANNQRSCTGGAGVGGSSGSTSGYANTASGGGSANGPSANVATYELLGDGAVGLGDGFSPANALSLGGSGGDVNAACGQNNTDNVGMTPTAGVGAGGGSTQDSGYQPRGATQNGGVFAGGGAMAVSQTDNFIFYAGNGGGGAGGGAGARITSSNVTSIESGSGGNGVVLIQILEKS